MFYLKKYNLKKYALLNINGRCIGVKGNINVRKIKSIMFALYKTLLIQNVCSIIGPFLMVYLVSNY